MIGEITLKKPIMINGEEVKTLRYDTEKITIEDYLNAIGRAVTKSETGITGANIRIDSGAQAYIGFYAVIAADRKIDISDMERITGSDIIKFVDIGLSFIGGREDQTEEPSEAQSETTQEPTSPAPQTSKKQA